MANKTRAIIEVEGVRIAWNERKRAWQSHSELFQDIANLIGWTLADDLRIHGATPNRLRHITRTTATRLRARIVTMPKPDVYDAQRVY